MAKRYRKKRTLRARFARWFVRFAASPFAEMLTWVGTVFGGIIVSGAQGDVALVITGALVVLVAVAPLAVQGVLNWRETRRDDALDGRESIAQDYTSMVLNSAADWEETGRAGRVEMANKQIDGALDAIWYQYFSSNEHVRVTLFEINSTGTKLVPTRRRGRPGDPREFDSSADARGEIAIERLGDTANSFYCRDVSDLSERYGATGRSYKQFIALPVRSTRKAYGMVTVDSDRFQLLFQRDADALEGYASAIAFFMASAARGAHTGR